MEDLVKREPNVSLTSLIGGDSRQLEVRLDPLRLEGYGLDAAKVAIETRRVEEN